MSEFYTLDKFTARVNSENNGPPYDPTKTEPLLEALRSKKATQGDIIAQAELQNRETQRQEATIEAKIAQAEKVITDMREWLTQDGTYSSEEIDERLSKLTVEYDNDTDQVITSGSLNLRSLTSAEGLTLPQSVGGDLDLLSLTSAEGLTLPQSVGGTLYLLSLTSAEGLILPQSVGGSLYLNYLTSAEGLTLPQSVGGRLRLDSLTSAEGLTFPESVGGDLDLYDLTSAEGLDFPQSVGGSLWLTSLTPEDRQKIYELRPDLHIYV